MMKYFIVGLLMIIWMGLTAILAISLIGMIMLLDEDSIWMELPKRLMDWK